MNQPSSHLHHQLQKSSHSSLSNNGVKSNNYGLSSSSPSLTHANFANPNPQLLNHPQQPQPNQQQPSQSQQPAVAAAAAAAAFLNNPMFAAAATAMGLNAAQNHTLNNPMHHIMNNLLTNLIKDNANHPAGNCYTV